MATVTFITPEQERITATGTPPNLMFLARQHKVPGILGKCGGKPACVTCHVHVQPDYMAAVGPAGERERELLEQHAGTTEFSRLSCQIEVTDAIDGAEFTVIEK